MVMSAPTPRFNEMRPDAATELSSDINVYTLADAYLAGFSAGSHMQKVIDAAVSQVDAKAPGIRPDVTTDLTTLALLGRKEDMADVAVKWAIDYLSEVQNQQGGMSKGLGLHDDHQEGSFQPGSSSLDPILLDVSPELHAFESAQNGPEDGHLGSATPLGMEVMHEGSLSPHTEDSPSAESIADPPMEHEDVDNGMNQLSLEAGSAQLLSTSPF